ncbi:flippase [Citrobacter werkmanii]|uniref:flippase n=1 Tax=Citrobacter werkmanii TaxID=67827 RepID=UPI00351D8E51
MKKYLSNLFWLLSDRVFMLVFQLSLFSAIKRLYGLDTLGEWATITNLSQLLLSFFLLGIDVIVVKRIVEDPNKAGNEIGSALFLQFLGIVAYTLSMIAIVYFAYSHMEYAIFFLSIILISNLLSLFSKVIYFHYSALVESKYRAFTIILSITLSYIYLWMCIYFEWYVFYAYLLFYVFQGVLSVIIYFYWFKPGCKWVVDRHTVKIYFSLGMKLIISTVSVSLFAQCDVLLLEHLVGTNETGAFSAALRISAIWFMCAGIIGNAFFPKIVQLANRNENDAFLFLEWICGAVSLLTVIASIVVTFLAPFIMKILYGEGMLLSSRILSIHIWTSLFIFLGAFSSKWLYAKNWINLDIYKTVIAAILNVILNIIFIPIYGAIGAAIVSMISYCIANFIFFLFIKKTKPLFFMQLKSLVYIFTPWRVITNYSRVKCLFQ